MMAWICLALVEQVQVVVKPAGGHGGQAVHGVVAVVLGDRAGAVGVAAGDDGAAGLVVAGQLLGRDLLAVAGVAGAVAAPVIGQDVALGAS